MSALGTRNDVAGVRSLVENTQATVTHIDRSVGLLAEQVQKSFSTTKVVEKPSEMRPRDVHSMKIYYLLQTLAGSQDIHRRTHVRIRPDAKEHRVSVVSYWICCHI
jgi:hypothetical protein